MSDTRPLEERRYRSVDSSRARSPNSRPKSLAHTSLLASQFPEAVDGNLYDLEKDWKYFAPGLIFKSYGVGKDERRDKIAAFDLDGTIIRTKSGQDFAKGATDWCQFNAKVFAKLEKFHKDGYRVVIFSNQVSSPCAQRFAHSSPHYSLIRPPFFSSCQAASSRGKD